ncbi:DNA replication ATP-dependent helicase/nuclease DNA2-like [Ptychodera flava]|uniref:DNA replication ATP-dependent helicase/nuclease DNA2-like n=1 Tax=Ptychodera flava TaxID=63121 RepID=UPI00396AAADD
MVKSDKRKGPASTGTKSKQPVSNNSSILQYFGKKKDEPKPSSKLFTTLGKPSNSACLKGQKEGKVLKISNPGIKTKTSLKPPCSLETLKSTNQTSVCGISRSEQITVKAVLPDCKTKTKDQEADEDFKDALKKTQEPTNKIPQHFENETSTISVPETPDKEEVSGNKVDHSIIEGKATPLDDSIAGEESTSLDDDCIPCTPSEKRSINKFKQMSGNMHVSNKQERTHNPFSLTDLGRQREDKISHVKPQQAPLMYDMKKWSGSVSFKSKLSRSKNVKSATANSEFSEHSIHEADQENQVPAFQSSKTLTEKVNGLTEDENDVCVIPMEEDCGNSKSEKGNLDLPEHGGHNSGDVAMDTSMTGEVMEELEGMGYLMKNSPLKSNTPEFKWKSVKIKKKITPGRKRNISGQNKHKYVSWTGTILGKRSPMGGISPCKKKAAMESQSPCQDSQRARKRQSVRSLLQEMNVSDNIEEGKEPFIEAGDPSHPVTDTSHSLDSGGSTDQHDGTSYHHDNCDSLETTDENSLDQGQLLSQQSTESSISEIWGSLNESMLAALDMDGLESNNTTPDKQQANHSLLNSSAHIWSQSQKPAFLQNRYKVMQSEYKPGQLTLTVSSTHHDTITEKKVILKGIWSSTLVDIGSTVSVHGDFDTTDTCIVDQERNFILVEPDLLLTGTNIASSIRCARRSVLNEIFKGSDFSSKAMACGTLLHEVFQQAIVTRSFSMQALQNIVMTTIAKQPHLNNMYILGIQESDMLDIVEPYLIPIEQWAKTYLQSSPAQRAKLDIKFPGENKSKPHKICVSDIRDIEDNIWSPQWGIKGKIDITAEVKIHGEDRTNRRTDTYVLPLELKTGKPTNSVEHRSQLILYSLMLSEVITPDSGLGLLLYLKNGSMMSVPANHMDKRELLNLRNKLAYYLNKGIDNDVNSESFPEMIEDDFTCRRCPQLQKCALVYRTVEKESLPVSDAIKQILWDEVGHLDPVHLEYFTKWYTLCRLEMASMKKSVFWNKSSQQRELSGQCMGDMMMYGPVNKSIDGQYISTFCRHGQQSCSQLISSQAISSVGIGVGDRLVISLQDLSRIALCYGIVTDIDDKTITIVTEKDLGIFYDRETTVYRLDKDEGFSVMTTSLNNLAQLLSSQNHCVNLSDLIIKLKTPDFSDQDISSIVPADQLNTVQEILKTSNSDQQRAICNVLRCKTHSLIVGMPGTGKTTTIVNLVRVLIACKMSVLLTSYTHSAVDNILLKLKKHGLDFLRIGAVNKIHSELIDCSDHTLSKQCGSVEDLESLYKSKPIVASTCLGIKHVLFTRRRFDVCIVDEASQIGQMVCIGPLLCADRFVLVGDHRQLPPLVKSKKAREMGMDESLFQRLACHEGATTDLWMQYRMNSSIMEISNTLIYDGKLKCGNDKIATGRLRLPEYSNYIKHDSIDRLPSLSWLPAAIDPDVPVCFLNTDKLPARHQTVHHSLLNQAECKLVCLLVLALNKTGCDFSDIGVIAPYRQQCQLISGQMSNLGHHQRLEVNTVDKYQGRDKDVIIVSFVRSSEEEETVTKGFGILEDVRRLNVAVTRAKYKVIMIGSVSTLSQYTPLKMLLGHLQDKKLISFAAMSV